MYAAKIQCPKFREKKDMNVSREGHSQGYYKKQKNSMLDEERHYRPNTHYSNSAARMSDALSSCHNRPM